jgi:hypothetical protein
MNGLEPLKVLYKPGQSLGLIAQVSFLLLLSIDIKIPLIELSILNLDFVQSEDPAFTCLELEH